MMRPSLSRLSSLRSVQEYRGAWQGAGGTLLRCAPSAPGRSAHHLGQAAPAGGQLVDRNRWEAGFEPTFDQVDGEHSLEGK